MGRYIAALRKNTNREIAEKATLITEKWKKIVLASPPTSKRGTSQLTLESFSEESAPKKVKDVEGQPKPTADFRKTGDAIRDKCIEMMFNAFMENGEEDVERASQVATEIELALYSEFDCADNRYKTKLRSKYLNLKDKNNPQLRGAVLEGSISAKQFCTMTAAEMASEERQREDREIEERNMLDSRVAADTQAETDQFKCGKCHQRKTKYYQMQTRSADEPMTTYVTCINCGNRWKFC